jgi:hypothetical protein
MRDKLGRDPSERSQRQAERPQEENFEDDFEEDEVF